MYRIFLTLLISLTAISIGHAQPLEIGDAMPDVLLGETLNNTTGAKRLSDFKGKLVILEFWHSTCGTCIEGFPHMAALQKKFRNQIRVLLVNPYETAAQITLRFNGPLRNIQLPALPILCASKLLGRYFPSRFSGHTAWIDENGIVRLIGSSLNNHEKKIRELLSGKPIAFLREGKKYNRTTPLSVLPSGHPGTKFSSMLTGFNDTLGEAFVYNFIDTASQTIRNTFINKDVATLFLIPYRDSLKSSWGSLLYSTNPLSYYLDPIEMMLTDTLRYTYMFPRNSSYTDEDYIRCTYCYEQIVTDNISPQLRNAFMIADLNRHFYSLFRTQVTLETFVLPCYKLVELPGKKPLPPSDEVSSSSLQDLVSRAFSSIFPNDKHGPYQYIFNESGKTSAALVIPDKITTMRELRDILQTCGLDIIKSEKKVKKVVLREAS